jgi:hypothetical protein
MLQQFVAMSSVNDARAEDLKARSAGLAKQAELFKAKKQKLSEEKRRLDTLFQLKQAKIDDLQNQLEDALQN